VETTFHTLTEGAGEETPGTDARAEAFGQQRQKTAHHTIREAIAKPAEAILLQPEDAARGGLDLPV